ncbi:MMPL family transporter [Verrucomicrobiaceae bacterium 5K15]|uniref:MMPL family transporter n=1 Tax=Oceaniferula flava TaxID=2800421 RepID=A0AAE2SEN2_9BACT|nr:MMPL family transporter [Oceaniferula flavus]MBK1854916.1 MMPL family transporter [Oceaniferula flavus]MBM1136222.1 MMPL family transporter [Oceaniferula flavus]
MLKKFRSPILLILLVLFSIAGLTRLKFETAILEVLPKNLPAIQALKDFQEHFSEDREVIVLLHSDEEEIVEEDVEALALFLRERWPDTEVRYKSAFEENPKLFGETVAHIWSYAPAEEIEKLTARLQDPDQLNAHLNEVKENLQNSFDQQQATIDSYDPLGFLRHPALQHLLDNDASFASDDGQSRLMMIRRKHESSIGYNDDKLWIEEIRRTINEWQQEEDYDYSFKMTGGPVYNAEIGSSMEHDMSGTITITSLCIGLLFLLVQRSFSQLLMISVLLGLTFVITLGVAGWVFQTLNLVSVGFAAILLGLVIDYAVVIIRESPHAVTTGAVPHRAKAIRKMVAPSILWAAASTSLVFGVLMLSTFTGVQQLGALIAIGLVSGALVMLLLTPVMLARFPVKQANTLVHPAFLPPRIAPWLCVLAVVVAGVLFGIKGAPQVNLDLKIVEPNNSEAVAAFNTLKEEFSAWSEQNAVMLTTAESLPELSQKTAHAETVLQELEGKNTIEQFYWPVGLLPNDALYQNNRSALTALAENSREILKTAGAAGFSEVGLGLDQQILEAFKAPALSSDDLAQRSADDPLIGAFYSRDADGRSYFTGRIMLAELPSPEALEKLKPLDKAEVVVTGYTMMQAVLLPRVKRDFYVIFIPAAALLLAALLLVFRSWRDALISISVLLTALILINAVVVASGQAWNFLSGMAIPLIVGAGIDYSIHLIFALRRQEGCFSSVWNSVGKAICFCGVSTSIGFGSLLFASNEALRSMGMLCSIGILITMSLSLLVIPGLWKRSHHRRLTRI